MGIASSSTAVAVTLDKDLCPAVALPSRVLVQGQGRVKVTKEAELIYQPEWKADHVLSAVADGRYDRYRLPGIKNMGPEVQRLLEKHRPQDWWAVALTEYEKADMT